MDAVSSAMNKNALHRGYSIRFGSFLKMLFFGIETNGQREYERIRYCGASDASRREIASISARVHCACCSAGCNVSSGCSTNGLP